MPETTLTLDVTGPDGPRPVDVRVERVGSGTPLLLLHGIGHHLAAWRPVTSLLAADHDVIAVDLPGFGASDPLPEGVPHDLASVVPVLGALCAALGVERPHVAGNSLGGLLALEMGRVGLARSVTALSPAGFWTEPERLRVFLVLLAMRGGARALPDAAAARLVRTAAGRAALTGAIYARPGRRSPEAVLAETRALRGAPGFASTLAAGRTVRFTDDVPDVPVTVAWGDRDLLLPPRQGVRAKRILPGARLVRLPGAGHVPMNDDPALVARVVRDTTLAADAAEAARAGAAGAAGASVGAGRG
ncbi:alpha/beta fold hydrolase [Streptomyces sp. BI20]|uniref:alpha/beta fold hydrolase n=1 Tax=Streptomyces sp. BI20 TaxID=3403460 RepID=UPI003C748DF3